MKILWFSMLLAWPLPGGGRIPSIAYAKILKLPMLDVLGVALLTFLCTTATTALLLKLVRQPKFQQFVQNIKNSRAGQKLAQQNWFKWLAGHMHRTESHYVSGRRSHHLLLAQLPWCPGGLFSSIGLISRWQLDIKKTLPIVLVSGWASFVAYYFAAGFSYYVLAALLAGPVILRHARRRLATQKV